MDPDCRAILQVLKSPTRLYEDPVKQERLATKLPSVAFPNGNRGIGPHDIAMLGVGSAHVTIGLEGRLSARDRLLPGSGAHWEPGSLRCAGAHRASQTSERPLPQRRRHTPFDSTGLLPVTTCKVHGSTSHDYNGSSHKAAGPSTCPPARQVGCHEQRKDRIAGNSANLFAEIPGRATTRHRNV